MAKLFKDGEIPEIPVYIDSPLAISATEIFRNNEKCFDEETSKILLSGDSPLDFPNLEFSRTADESKSLNEVNGAIIISASGMCTAGRIKYHLQNNLYRPESSVIFVGYQAEGTLGRRLIDGSKRVRLYGKDVAVKAKIHTLGGFSAHADRDGILEWISHIDNPKLKVFVLHGEEEASLSMAESIREKFGYETLVPNWGEIINLENMRSNIASYGSSDAYTSLDREIEAIKSTLETLNAQYNRAKSENRVRDIKKLKSDLVDIREMLGMFTDDL